MKIVVDVNLRNVLSWLLAVVFIWAAISKLANLEEFYSDLVAYRLPLPELPLQLAALTLPWLELLCGLLLLGRIWLRAATVWVAVLGVIFVLATGQAWARGLDISCGCMNLRIIGLGGAAWLQSVGLAFFRAVLLTAAAVYLNRVQGREVAAKN